MSDTRFNSASAAEAGRKSAEARARKRLLTPHQRALEAINDERLIRELQQAAFGEGDFGDLKLETRVTALVKLLEYKLGRPATQKAPPKEEQEVESAPAPEDLFE